MASVLEVWIDSLLVKKTRSYWLSSGDLKGETESEVTAAQDLALQTKYHATKLLPTATGSRCRLGQQCDETTGHMRAQYWQENRVLSDMVQCVLNCTLTCARNYG
jgi:hypothetical protein